MSGLGGISPVTFVLVPEREEARAFYSGKLGLTPVSENEFALGYDLGGTILRVTFVPDYVPHMHTVLGWNVDDIYAVIGQLRGRGIDMLVYEGFGQDADGVWSAPDGSTKLAWFNDPFGNNLSLMESR